MTVIIVGGGIVGLASAYFLRRRGVDVTVLERDRIGAGSTPRAGGGIREQFSTPESIALSKKSIEVWEQFETTFGTDIEYHRPGYLYLARTKRTAEQIRTLVEIHKEHDVPSTYLSPDEAATHCPGLKTDRYVGATYCPTDGYANTERALQAFAVAAAREGASIQLGHRIRDVLKIDDGPVTGVATDTQAFDADAVINATGAWAGQIATQAGISLPVTPERRQALVVETETELPASVPFVTDLDTGSYLRRRSPHTAQIGGHFSSAPSPVDPDQFAHEPDDEWIETCLSTATDCTAYVDADSRIVDGWAGLYAMTPDQHPIIEETVPGLIHAVGFSGHGFMQSPATGKLVAELVTEGTASLVDISRLGSDRFDNGETLKETFYSA